MVRPGASEDQTGVAGEAETVASFLDALQALDTERVVSYVAPDILYQNVSLPSVRGRVAFGRVMRLLARMSTGFEVTTHRIAANGPVVLTERTDVLVFGPLRIRFWVCGVFEVRQGRITLWRDYFDWAAFLTGLARGLLGTVPESLRR